MNWNPFKKKKQPEQSLFDIQELEKLKECFDYLNTCEKANLLHCDFSHKTVTISSILSQFFIYDDTQWQKFLQQVHLWAMFRFSVNAYNRSFTKAMADAEARASKEIGGMLDYNTRRLKRMEAAAAFDPETEVEKCPDLQFVVIGATSDNQPLVVARYINGRYEYAAVPDSL